MTEKKKILILIPHYLPGNKMGGPLSSIVNMVDNLSNDFLFNIITTDRDLADKTPYKDIHTNTWLDKGFYNIFYAKQSPFLIYNLIKQINKTNNDVLYLNSFFSYIFSIAIIIAQKLKIINAKAIVIAPRGEAYFEALNFKKWKKKIYLVFASIFNLYKKDIVWHASTEYEKNLIVENFGADPQNVYVAINMAAKEIEYLKDDEILNNNQNLSIVFLSRISKDKNISFVFDVLNKIAENITLDIFGPIEDEYIWKECIEKIKTLPSNIVVNYKGIAEKRDVAKILRQYDLMFLPTLAENYGHVIVESLTVGTPVLISDNTPWRDLEKDGLGWDLSLENPQLFIEVIIKMAGKTQILKPRSRIANSFIKRIKDPSIYIENRELFNKAISNTSNKFYK